VTGKQLKHVSKQLAQALKPAFVYTSIIRENFIRALKEEIVSIYNTATILVTESEYDADDPSSHWSPKDEDPDDPTKWPVSSAHVLCWT
jgi:hypothetical protein